MPDKFIIHGATFNGNGTTSAAATSNGGVGAWNNINVLEGTAPAFGTLAAGDTVYIRSKDAAGADITRTATANVTFGNSAATSAGWITWVIDDGTIWPGVVGSVTYTHASSFSYLLRSYNHVLAPEHGLFRLLVTGTSSPVMFNTAGAVEGRMTNTTFDSTGQTGAGSVTWNIAATKCTLDNPRIRLKLLGINGVYLNTASGRLALVNPDIWISEASANLFRMNDIAVVDCFGGRIGGPGTLSGTMAVCGFSNLYASNFRMAGTSYPIEMRLYLETAPWTATTPAEASALWSDDSFGGEYANAAGEYTSRNDGNFPYLDATFPNPSESGWSWRCYGRRASSGLPLEISLAKQLSDGGATKEISVEVLVANGFVGLLNKQNLYLVGSYIDDSTGNLMTFSTREDGALDTSTAAWSSLTYGAVNMTSGRRRIAYQTPTAVRAGSKVFVRMYCTQPAVGVSDYFFVSPDVRVV